MDRVAEKDILSQEKQCSRGVRYLAAEAGPSRKGKDKIKGHPLLRGTVDEQGRTEACQKRRVGELPKVNNKLCICKGKSPLFLEGSVTLGNGKVRNWTLDGRGLANWVP